MDNAFLSTIWRYGIFDGKVLFCTGGSGDICSAQVKAVVSLGANACIIGRNEEKAKRVAEEVAAVRSGSRVLWYKADVRKLVSLETAARFCAEELGGIDFVIAGAAGNFLAPYLHLSTNAFRAVVEIDLMGSWNCAKACTTYLLESAKRHGAAGGRIVFISSTTQFTGAHLATPGAVAKAGVDALSAQLAIELGPRGITSNVIAPGPIAGTEGVERLIDEGANSSSKIPRGRFGTLKDMGDSAVFLLSDAGDWVNGAKLVVDGGAWRVHTGQPGDTFRYPETVLADMPFSEVTKRPEYKL